MDEEHFIKQCKGLKEDTATGHNNVAPKELILPRGVIKPGRKSVIRKSIMVKKHPTDYKVAKMKTLFKKGEKTVILSQVSKFIEGQVCKEMDIHLEGEKIWNDNQWRFRKGKSTEGLLLQKNGNKNWMKEKW